MSKQYWLRVLQPEDIVIDATCGNGNDTLYLAQRVLTPMGGLVYSMDVQEQAIEKAKQKLRDNLDASLLPRVRYILGSHSHFPQEIRPASVALLVYNLGYLPGGNKALTTLSSSTIQSVQAALPLIKEGGVISITCYPGHLEGKKEEADLLGYTESLDKQTWSSCWHRWVNRCEAPSLLILQKSYDSLPSQDAEVLRPSA